MDEVLEILLKIKSLAEEIRDSTQELDTLPQKTTKLEKEIEKATADLDRKKSRVLEIKKEYKMKEGDIAENDEKGRKLNQQVFAVKTNEEYRAILNEIDFLKQTNKKTEDEMIMLLEEEEQLRSEMVRAETETAAFVENRAAEIAAQKKRGDELGEMQKTARAVYDDNIRKLPGDVRGIYERIARARGNAVCLITGNTCTGCFGNLTHQLLNEIKKRDRIVLCDSCGRILIYNGE